MIKSFNRRWRDVMLDPDRVQALKNLPTVNRPYGTKAAELLLSQSAA
jgi:hypothetical protein